jgi:uncharacterized tellurite resistance protein B-like protein
MLGAAMWVVQQAWPLLLAAAVLALLAYVVKLAAPTPETDAATPRPEPETPTPRPEPETPKLRSDTPRARTGVSPPVEPAVVMRRSGSGGLVIQLSLGNSTPRPTRQVVNPDTVWIPPGRSATVAGYSVPGGALYVGEGLAALNEWRGEEPALINPQLVVDRAQPDHTGQGMPYWPSYAAIPPASRAAYLEWLASGRRDPGVAIGYVFLFFYGIERRLLADTVQSAMARNERDQLVAEVKRLLEIYGNQRSFRSYAGSLIDAFRAQRRGVPLYVTEAPPVRTGPELPSTLRVALGQLVAEGKPIPGEWAWSWLLCSAEGALRTPGQRCPDECRTLFLTRYARQFEAGMTLKPNKTKLVIEYRPASASFGGPVRIPIDDLPDVTALSTPLRKLLDVADACAEDLAGYSRWLGRNPGGGESLEAAALLPPELLDDKVQGAIRPLREWLDGKLRDSPSAVVKGEDLLRFWPGGGGEKLAKSDAVSVAQLLERIGYGAEPDVRFGGPVLSADEPAVIFRQSVGAPSAGSAAYSSAALLLHVGAMVATADGRMNADEYHQLEAQLESALHLSPAEQARLRAHLAWLLAAPPGLAGLKKRVATLDETQRRSIARYTVAVAGADGHFDPAEVTALTKIYRPLGFTPEDAYSDIHALASASAPPAAEPVTVQRTDPAAQGFAIPAPPDSERSGAAAVKLDMARVRATLTQTKAVTALLSDIFTDDDPNAPPPAAPPPANDAAQVAGLDARHSALARALAGRPSWTRSEFDTMAAEHHLLPEGALDAINEAALDRCGEALCEGDDPLTVNERVAKELLA